MLSVVVVCSDRANAPLVKGPSEVFNRRVDDVVTMHCDANIACNQFSHLNISWRILTGETSLDPNSYIINETMTWR